MDGSSREALTRLTDTAAINGRNANKLVLLKGEERTSTSPAAEEETDREVNLSSRKQSATLTGLLSCVVVWWWGRDEEEELLLSPLDLTQKSPILLKDKWTVNSSSFRR